MLQVPPLGDISTLDHRVLRTRPSSGALPKRQIMLDRRGLLGFDRPEMPCGRDARPGPAEERAAAEQDQELGAAEAYERIVAAVERGQRPHGAAEQDQRETDQEGRPDPA